MAAGSESIAPLALLWVPALRSSAKRAVPRPGHERGSRGRVVICPTGSLLTPVSSPLCKNILLRHLVETDLLIPPSRPTRGALAIVANVGMGCGGRGSVLRAKRLQGGFFESVSDTERADERRCCGRRSRVVLTPRRWRQVCGGMSVRPD